MTTSRNAISQPLGVDWRSRSAESWRGRKAVMASRGEVDGPAVFECDLAMASWRAKRATEEVDRLRREHPTPKPARTAASS